MTLAPAHTARAHSRARGGAIPIWRWPSVLSLDAPLVAICWQLLLARVLAVTLPASSVALLFLPVWLVYVADRVIDGWRLPRLKNTTDRHQVHARSLPWLSVAWLAALSATVVTAAVSLDEASWRACLVLLGAALLYLLVVHLPSTRWPNRPWQIETPFALKELAVGSLFATGVALFPALLIQPVDPKRLWPVVFLSGLCSINCLLISLWELERGEVPADLRGWPRQWTGRLAAGLIVALLVSLLLTPHTHTETRAFLTCLLVSCFALVLLDCLRSALPLESLRVLADVVLLTPMVVLLAS